MREAGWIKMGSKRKTKNKKKKVVKKKKDPIAELIKKETDISGFE